MSRELEAGNVRIIWDHTNSGWYVRYNKPDEPDVDLDESMYMPNDPNLPDEELRMFAETALQFVGLKLPDSFEVMRGY